MTLLIVIIERVVRYGVSINLLLILLLFCLISEKLKTPTNKKAKLFIDNNTLTNYLLTAYLNSLIKK